MRVGTFAYILYTIPADASGEVISGKREDKMSRRANVAAVG